MDLDVVDHCEMCHLKVISKKEELNVEIHQDLTFVRNLMLVQWTLVLKCVILISNTCVIPIVIYLNCIYI